MTTISMHPTSRRPIALAAVFLLGAAAPLSGQAGPVSSEPAFPVLDSVPLVTTSLPSDTVWESGHLWKQTLPPATLITLGLLAYQSEGFLSRESVKEWRTEYIPQFEDHIDDWGQIAPGVLALGLEIGGVKGKHNLARSAGSWAMGTTIMMAGVHGVKNLAEVMRPNGANTHSFPSGHTASAFTAARYLQREYGEVSSVYPVIGYGIAAGTGVFRQLNDAHWLSDVLVGAGIGFLSTDLAYAIMDEIFGEKGRNPVIVREPEPRGNPHFLDFRLGGANATGDIDSPEGDFKAGDGWNAGFEGAWFPWKHVGFGGDWSWASFPIDNSLYSPPNDEVGQKISGIYTQPLGSSNLHFGPFFDVPLSERFTLTGKALLGGSQGAEGGIFAQIRSEFVEEVGADEVQVVDYSTEITFGASTGAAIRFRMGERMSLRAYGEYNWSKQDYLLQSVEGFDDEGQPIFGNDTVKEKVDFSYMAFGLSVTALFW